MVESGVTSKGQTTLPKAVRDALAVEAGDRIRYFIQGDQVRIAPVKSIKRLYGALPYDGPPVTLEEMDEAIAEGAAGR
jgi:AbrB family looped-hinge helix DNA binding protein